MEPLTDEEMTAWRSFPAMQQPDWGNDWLIGRVSADLTAMPALVRRNEIERLRGLLAEVALGERTIVQAGDCAEDPDECVEDVLSRKVGLLDALAGMMRTNTGVPVVRVGRIAGQFAKPRSRETVHHNGTELPVYRGPLVNGPAPEAGARLPDPLRLVACYRAAATATEYLRAATKPTVWTSHEALILDYELPLVRRSEDGHLFLTSTHLPWIGDRTRDLDGVHVRLLSAVRNPVACKIGPNATAEQVLGLCDRLDPAREPGRLTLVARLGAGVAAHRLPELVTVVRAAGHPVIWLCDPMHANTVVASNGRKIRLLPTVLREVGEFQDAVTSAGGIAGGLHLETTPHDVLECVDDEAAAGTLDNRRYTTLCDPRLNIAQALTVVSAWRTGGARRG
ncbi:3-deoxy-7-phosphoheptulonate synthase [Actinophytocola sp.]|uniref:3-deoxy-7-phosphoheptulonate synthase n=1 Tax=Actinophytocola sp. TaxID=1872138 RepID=UPI003899D912